MKKYLYNLIWGILFLSVALFYSCDGFLDKEPPGSAAGTVMQTPEGVEALLIGTCKVS